MTSGARIVPKPDPLEGDLLEVSMGPHHPSTHGVFQMDVKLRGERIFGLKPVFGYLHRNHEKIAEEVSYLASIPYTDRLDYMATGPMTLATAPGAELLGVSWPSQARRKLGVGGAAAARPVQSTIASRASAFIQRVQARWMRLMAVAMSSISQVSASSSAWGSQTDCAQAARVAGNSPTRIMPG